MNNKEVREMMRTNAHNLVKVLLNKEQEFRLVIWNNDDWDEPLPENIMSRFPLQLVLDFKGETLEYSFVEDNRDIILVAAFTEGERFEKQLLPEDIVAILDLDGQPMQVNNFSPEEVKPDKVRESIETKDDLIKFLEEDGIPKEAALRSLNAFQKNNPGKFKILEEK
jgi:23S rRNA pseudoU1915 N3-methylase RlmH